MVTPDKIRNDAAKADALLEAFERSFLHLVDVGDEAPDERERSGDDGLYGLRDMLQKIIVELEELSGHMEVCDAVFAANEAKKGGDKND